MLHAGANLTAAIALMFGAELADWLEEVAESGGVAALLKTFG